MRRKLVQTVLLLLIIIVGGYLLQSFLPWWILTVVALAAAALLAIPPLPAFWGGLLGGMLLWGGYALWLSTQNDGILLGRLTALLSGSPPIVLFLITALIGGLLAGTGALTGSLGRQLLRRGDGESG